MAAAVFHPVDRPDLSNVGGDFYQVIPAKGSRISGVFRVRVSSHDVEKPGANQPLFGGNQRRAKVTAPKMHVDLSPTFTDQRGSASDKREPLTINGKTYDGTLSASVEFMPTSGHGDPRRNYLPTATVGGAEYLLNVTIHSHWDGFTGSAGLLLDSVLQPLAAQYVTQERFQAHLVRMAEAAVGSAQTKVDAAQAVLAKAEAELEAVKTAGGVASEAA